MELPELSHDGVLRDRQLARPRRRGTRLAHPAPGRQGEGQFEDRSNHRSGRLTAMARQGSRPDHLRGRPGDPVQAEGAPSDRSRLDPTRLTLVETEAQAKTTLLRL